MNKQIYSFISLYKGTYCYDFKYFRLRTLEGVLNQYRKLTKKVGLRPIFFESYWHADRIEFKQLIGKEIKLTKVFTPQEFMSLIGWANPPMKTDKEFFKDSWVVKELMNLGLITLE